jgi:hypothetical protein
MRKLLVVVFVVIWTLANWKAIAPGLYVVFDALATLVKP